MGGVLTHTCVVFFKFFFAAIKQGTIAIFSIVQDKTFWFWADLTNSSSNWFALGFFNLTFIAFLYHFHIIKKKKFEEYDEIVWAFLIGVGLHLIFDLFYIETSAWI